MPRHIPDHRRLDGPPARNAPTGDRTNALLKSWLANRITLANVIEAIGQYHHDTSNRTHPAQHETAEATTGSLTASPLASSS